ncbi:hypothetical protein [Fodinicola acaciae]|uniref:hypothetical protein n=1 Tax=Fodinicola acaciae TaxID=2681555 RepID=UPI0013D4E3D5|nr:hypothetical protein [Fodinicola acaciae]
MVKKTWSLWCGVGKARLSGFCRNRSAVPACDWRALAFWLIWSGIQVRTPVASGGRWVVGFRSDRTLAGNLSLAQRKTSAEVAVTEASPRISRNVITTAITCGNRRFVGRGRWWLSKNISGAEGIPSGPDVV